jgi:hypothetical protein
MLSGKQRPLIVVSLARFLYGPRGKLAWMAMMDEDFSKRLNERLQPELDRLLADHDRFLQLLVKMPEPSEDQKRAIAEANTPEGWQRAVDAEVGVTQKRKVPLWSVAVWLSLIFLTCVVIGALRLLISN